MTAPIRTLVATPPEPGSVTEITEDVRWIRLPLPMVLDHVNCYALRDDDGWTIVDTGFDTSKQRAIWRDVIDNHLDGAPVVRVLVTHHHPDHIGLAGWFVSEFGAELITTRTAYLMARMLYLDEQDAPLPETLAFWRSAGMDPELYAKRAAERPFNFCDAIAKLPLGYTRIVEGQVLRLAGRDWTIRMGNGHAPEHATLWSETGDLVLGGDQLLASISPNIGVHATEPGADPLGEWLEACERLRPFATDNQLVLPGHKLPYTGLPTRMGQLIDNHHSALTRLTEFLRTPRTATGCFDQLFKRKIGESEYGLAMVEAMAHLNHLYLTGKITRTRREDDAWLWQTKE
ncbi:MBL fold metallo-hydrolase [Aliiroseovarius sp. PTFE2010]|uniref:MBL fold metallo-hydrolase n=1 Tax=Aliiroseovarius sp. PTFE2010 TaxID=3417190 RepID=UPI003CEBEC27